MTGSGRIVAVIPARGGSKRIPRKNLVDVCGMPLIGWTIRAALGSSWLAPSSVYVSTDDTEIAAIAEAMGAIALSRPAQLATDDAWTEPVIQHAVLAIEASGIPVDVVVWMNPCVPQLTSADIDHAIAMLNEHALREVVAVDCVGRSSSAVRVLGRETLFQGRLSVKFGVLTLPYRDVNTVEDLVAVRSLLPEGGQSPGGGND